MRILEVKALIFNSRLKLLYKPMPWDAVPGVAGKENIERKKRQVNVHNLRAVHYKVIKSFISPATSAVIQWFSFSIERLTDMWCDELQRHRLTAYR